MAPNKHNAFYYFMMEYKNKNYPRGTQINMIEISERAGLLWRNMSAEEREEYKHVTKTMNKGQIIKKYTTTGLEIQTVLNNVQQQKNLQVSMVDDINAIVNGAGDGIINLNLCLIHINTFCMVAGNYYPAEIAIAKFNLRNGVIVDKVFHKFCYPGKMPLGYAYTIQQQSDATHQIPYPDQKNNLMEVYSDIIAFLSEDNFRTLPPVYSFRDNMDVCTSVMNMLNNYCDAQLNPVKVYCLANLFHVLRNYISAGEAQALPTVEIAALQLEKDMYDYTRRISCDYHENSDVLNFCSKSIVVRRAYIICDHCLADLDINIIPGQHVPLNTKIPFKSFAGANSSFSSCPSIHCDDDVKSMKSDLSTHLSNMTLNLVDDDVDCEKQYPGSCGTLEVESRYDDLHFVTSSQETKASKHMRVPYGSKNEQVDLSQSLSSQDSATTDGATNVRERGRRPEGRPRAAWQEVRIPSRAGSDVSSYASRNN